MTAPFSLLAGRRSRQGDEGLTRCKKISSYCGVGRTWRSPLILTFSPRAGRRGLEVGAPSRHSTHHAGVR